MRPFLTFIVGLLLPTGIAAVTLPATPLTPLYHALLTKRSDLAWQQLLISWPQISSAAQRDAWLQALDALITVQCGNDLPVAIPDWLDHPSLSLIQRDMPLNRIYRVQLSGNSPSRQLRVVLSSPDGRDLMAGAEQEYNGSDGFSIQSQDLNKPLAAGIYLLTVRSGSEMWQQPLALQGSNHLNWIQLQQGKIKLHPPTVAAACPAPWLEQALLRRDSFAQVAWHRSDDLQLHNWPPRDDAENLWGTASVIRVEARGGVTLRFEHRMAGPLLTLKN